MVIKLHCPQRTDMVRASGFSNIDKVTFLAVHFQALMRGMCYIFC